MYRAMQRTLLVMTGLSALFGCATESVAPGPGRAPTWAASRVRTDTASRSPPPRVPATAPGALT